MNQLQTIGNTFMYSLQAFFLFLPTLLGAALVLVLGWFVAKMVARLVEKGLHSIGFENAANRSGIGRFVRRSGSSRSTSQIVAQLAKWFIFLIFVQGAANLLAMPQLTNIINSIMLFIPNLLVGVAILVVASLVADFISGVVRASLSEAGMEHSELLARIAGYAVIAFGVIAALNQIGIATTVVNTLFIGLVGSIALAAGLAFGLGGRDVAARITASWYEEGKRAAGRVTPVDRQKRDVA
jgi:hypothetical protein